MWIACILHAALQTHLDFNALTWAAAPVASPAHIGRVYATTTRQHLTAFPFRSQQRHPCVCKTWEHTQLDFFELKLWVKDVHKWILPGFSPKGSASAPPGASLFTHSTPIVSTSIIKRWLMHLSLSCNFWGTQPGKTSSAPTSFLPRVTPYYITCLFSLLLLSNLKLHIHFPGEGD